MVYILAGVFCGVALVMLMLIIQRNRDDERDAKSYKHGWNWVMEFTSTNVDDIEAVARAFAAKPHSKFDEGAFAAIQSLRDKKK